MLLVFGGKHLGVNQKINYQLLSPLFPFYLGSVNNFTLFCRALYLYFFSTPSAPLVRMWEVGTKKLPLLGFLPAICREFLYAFWSQNRGRAEHKLNGSGLLLNDGNDNFVHCNLVVGHGILIYVCHIQNGLLQFIMEYA